MRSPVLRATQLGVAEVAPALGAGHSGSLALVSPCTFPCGAYQRVSAWEGPGGCQAVT